MDPAAARTELLAQHHALRHHLRAVRAAALAAAGEDHLISALAELSVALTEHNAAEEALLAPLLPDTDAFGEVRLARMRTEHAQEHGAIIAFLERPLDQVVAGLDDFVEQILAHMDAEERTFLHPNVLRDDLVTVDHAGA
ncbi:MAG: hemerythrin domain-containing protein [Kofleriaceae bacterium]